MYTGAGPCGKFKQQAQVQTSVQCDDEGLFAEIQCIVQANTVQPAGYRQFPQEPVCYCVDKLTGMFF